MNRIAGTTVLCLVFSLMFLGSYGQSSQTFVITDDGGVLDATPYENALSTANLELYRQVSQRTTMKFSNGMLVELLSGKEIAALGVPVDLETMQKNNQDGLKTSLFELHASGIIMERKDLDDFKNKK